MLKTKGGLDFSKMSELWIILRTHPIRKNRVLVFTSPSKVAIDTYTVQVTDTGWKPYAVIGPIEALHASSQGTVWNSCRASLIFSPVLCSAPLQGVGDGLNQEIFLNFDPPHSSRHSSTSVQNLLQLPISYQQPRFMVLLSINISLTCHYLDLCSPQRQTEKNLTLEFTVITY